jgi:hypothetical protein
MWGFLAIAAFLLSAGADAAPARCFLHGIMVPKLENKEKTSLSDMIRLHFDVSSKDDQAKCEQMMESYCVNNVRAKDYSPERLKGSFKPDMDKSDETTYTFTDRCKLETD